MSDFSVTKEYDFHVGECCTIQLASGCQLVADGGIERILQVCYDLINLIPAATVKDVDDIEFVMGLIGERLAP